MCKYSKYDLWDVGANNSFFNYSILVFILLCEVRLKPPGEDSKHKPNNIVYYGDIQKKFNFEK